jgi:Na+/proline symporter
LNAHSFSGQANQEGAMRGFIIGALVVAVGVLGYLYWDSQHNTVFKAPGVEIKKS